MTLQHTLQDLEQLLATPAGFAELPDVAFGLVRMAPETPPSAYAGRFGLPLPELTKILKGGAPTPSLQPSGKSPPPLAIVSLAVSSPKGVSRFFVDANVMKLQCQVCNSLEPSSPDAHQQSQ